MKTIGLLGGMGWESTAEYYRLINQKIKGLLGGFHSAKIVLISVDFAEIQKLQTSGQWQQASEILADAARQAQSAGAEVLLICTNTMHKVVDIVQTKIDIPILHVADSVVESVKAKKIKNVLLIGTRFTMEDGFYAKHLEDRGLNVIVPEQRERNLVHQIIFDELIMGIISEESKKTYLDVIKKSQQMGAEAVILGCTEIGLLVNQQDLDMPVFDTTILHAESAVAWSLN